MKKLVLILALTFISAPAFAADVADELGMRQGGSYGMAGCGLGSMVFEENSMTSQILAATTNGTFGSQTFGISSGTSNCSTSGIAKIEKEKEMFVSMNFETLSKEMAQGKGETLNALAGLYGCEDTTQFGKIAKENYKVSSTPTELIQHMDAQVAGRCGA